MQKSKCKTCHGTGKLVPRTGQDADLKVVYVECNICGGTGKLNGKNSLLDQLNEARASYGLAALSRVEADEMKLTKSKLEQAIHDYDTSSEAKPPLINITTASLLKRLNVVRVKHDKPSLGGRKKSRAALEAEIAKEEASTKHVTPQTIKPAIASGSGTTRYRTSMHTNKVEKQVAQMNKRETRDKFAQQQALADDVTTRTRQKRSIVLAWIVTRDYLTVKDLPKDFGSELDAFIASRESLKKTPTEKKTRSARPTNGHTVKPRKSEGLTPQSLAELLGRDAKALRVTLRRVEADIPKAWRIEGERWGFHKKHEADIAKLLGGKT